MAVAAARPHAFVVAAMRRVLEIRIIGLNSHRVTGSAKGVGRGVAVDRDAGNDVFALPKLQHSVELKIQFREPVIVDFGGKAANS